MIYKEFQGLRLSALGFGCMRLPGFEGQPESVDEEKVAAMVKTAFVGGVNYFDTAWGYHDGESENVMGRILAAYPRESYYLADKFPGYDLSNFPRLREIFARQLEKCRVAYFDFYLFHNVCEMNIDSYLDPKYGVYDYLMAEKKAGRIRHLGFSCHGHLPVLKRFLEAYGKDMEFCQLQLNWLDWRFQEAEEKVALLKEYGIPVWVMEPLRGGALASLSPEGEEKLRSLRPEETVPAWAFRFLQTLPEVKVILSGMSDMAQLEANLATFAEEKPLNEKELAALGELAEEMGKRGTVPCTACRYCTAHCPMSLDIPYLLSLYNEHALTGGGFIAPMALMALPEDKQPSACVGCRSCTQVCPQQIAIPDHLAKFAEMLRG